MLGRRMANSSMVQRSPVGHLVVPAGQGGSVDELLQGDPGAAPGPPRPGGLLPLPALRRPAGGLPGERRPLLARGPEVQGEVGPSDSIETG